MPNAGRDPRRDDPAEDVEDQIVYLFLRLGSMIGIFVITVYENRYRQNQGPDGDGQHPSCRTGADGANEKSAVSSEPSVYTASTRGLS